MKTAAELLREKDAELDRLIDLQVDAWEQKERLRRFEDELEECIRAVEKEISDLTIKWQDGVREGREGWHEWSTKKHDADDC